MTETDPVSLRNACKEIGARLSHHQHADKAIAKCIVLAVCREHHIEEDAVQREITAILANEERKRTEALHPEAFTRALEALTLGSSP